MDRPFGFCRNSRKQEDLSISSRECPHIALVTWIGGDLVKDVMRGWVPSVYLILFRFCLRLVREVGGVWHGKELVALRGLRMRDAEDRFGRATWFI
jgi:hypothetical protein